MIMLINQDKKIHKEQKSKNAKTKFDDNYNCCNKQNHKKN